jgi:hypothetical protein
MKNINSKYIIPVTWDDINLKKFKQIIELEKRFSEMEPTDFTIKFLSLITGMDEDVLLDMDVKEIKLLSERLTTLVKSEIPVTDERFIEIDGVLYFLDLESTAMSFGQFVDLDFFSKEGVILWDYAHKVCASFLRPVKKYNRWILKGKRILGVEPKLKDYAVEKYDSKKIELNSEIFLDKLPMTFVYTCTCFFLTLKHEYQKHILDSSLNKEVEVPF